MRLVMFVLSACALVMSACDSALVMTDASCNVDLAQGISTTFVSTDAAGVVTSFAGRVGAARGARIYIEAGETDLNMVSLEMRVQANPPLNTPLSYDVSASYEDFESLPFTFSGVAPDGAAYQIGSVVVNAVSDSTISLNMTFSRYVEVGIAETLFIDAQNVPLQSCSLSAS